MITCDFSIFNYDLNTKNEFQNFKDFESIYHNIKNKKIFTVTEIPFSEMDKWKLTDNNICHDSGKFFKIEGIRIHTNYGNISTWDQPIINQNEIGILGIISKVINNTRYFLMQFKAEPGNVNILQLSPTVQATKSNFSKVHKGNGVPFLEYFIDKNKSKKLIDQLQSEQGGRFLKKRNRNMIVEIYDDIEINENFIWLTLYEIKQALLINNLVNMDARSVLSCIPLSYNSLESKYLNEEIINWFLNNKVNYELEVEKIPLSQLSQWKITKDKIFNNERYFSVIAAKIEIENREVASWTQPLFKDDNKGFIGLVMKRFNGEEHYLFQTKVMAGNIDIIDFSPSISTSNIDNLKNDEKPLFLDKFLDNNVNILVNTIQSEEGGRFYKLQTINMIIEIKEHFEIPENYIWLSKKQINDFMPYSLFNVESRSLISLL